jgi:hypothetical protein
VPWYSSYFSGATPPKARTRNSSGVGRLKGRRGICLIIQQLRGRFVCQIKEKKLYKPLNKKQQKEEEKKKDDLLSEKILLRSINAFKKDIQKLNLMMIFIMLKVLF